MVLSTHLSNPTSSTLFDLIKNSSKVKTQGYRDLTDHEVSRAPQKESFQILHECPLGLKDKLIKLCGSKVNSQGHNELRTFWLMTFLEQFHTNMILDKQGCALELVQG